MIRESGLSIDPIETWASTTLLLLVEWKTYIEEEEEEEEKKKNKKKLNWLLIILNMTWKKAITGASQVRGHLLGLLPGLQAWTTSV